MLDALKLNRAIQMIQTGQSPCHKTKQKHNYCLHCLSVLLPHRRPRNLNSCGGGDGDTLRYSGVVQAAELRA